MIVVRSDPAEEGSGIVSERGTQSVMRLAVPKPVFILRVYGDRDLSSCYKTRKTGVTGRAGDGGEDRCLMDVSAVAVVHWYGRAMLFRGPSLALTNESLSFLVRRARAAPAARSPSQLSKREAIARCPEIAIL
jgi:hypothetical protein